MRRRSRRQPADTPMIVHLIRIYGGRCCYCGCRVTYPRSDRYTDATIDHFIPKSLGGHSRAANFRLSCVLCNRIKAGMHPVVLAVMLRLAG
jgi:5-methylcytosine-specific restriction endonuclease McrA